MERTDQTIGEEIANSISHGIGAGLAIAGLILLTWRATSTGPLAVLCCAVFGASAILLYLVSTLYHSLSHTRAYRLMRSLDHGAIYLLIAGTYTPFSLIGLRGTVVGWSLFFGIWSCAAAGLIFKALFTGKLEVLSTVMYLAMGWAALLTIKSMYLLLAHPVFTWILAGGICYSAGIPFYASNRKYMHFIWHLWVLAGTLCHFTAVWFMLR